MGEWSMYCNNAMVDCVFFSYHSVSFQHFFFPASIFFFICLCIVRIFVVLLVFFVVVLSVC